MQQYLHRYNLVKPNQPFAHSFVERPMLGFNPFIYACDKLLPEQRNDEDAFADYIRSGQPTGRWHHQVIEPIDNKTYPQSLLKVAIHGHFHYYELLAEFISKLQLNKTPFDLFLTITSQAALQPVKEILSKFSLHKVQIDVVPNRGRDIGVFLSNYRLEQLKEYDVIGHFHGKRSLHMGQSSGNEWRNFIFEYLVSGKYLMMDKIMDCFANDPKLGLVFPEERYLNGWDLNLQVANELAAKMGLNLPNACLF